MIGKISKDTFCQKAYLSLKQSIIKGRLKPGEVLVIEKVAEQLGISPTPTREALIRLTSEGFIEYKSNKKRYVAPITPESVQGIYEVRKLLEPYATRSLARSIASDAEMKRELLELRELSDPALFHTVTAESYEKLMATDLRLSAILLEGIRGSFLAEVLNWINDRSLRIRTFLETSRPGKERSLSNLLLKSMSESLKHCSKAIQNRLQQLPMNILPMLNAVL